MFLNKYFFFYSENIALYDECFGHVILYSYCCFWRQYNDLANQKYNIQWVGGEVNIDFEGS